MVQKEPLNLLNRIFWWICKWDFYFWNMGRNKHFVKNVKRILKIFLNQIFSLVYHGLRLNKGGWLFLSHFWPHLKWVVFFDVIGVEAKIGSSLKPNRHNINWQIHSALDLSLINVTQARLSYHASIKLLINATLFSLPGPPRFSSVFISQ